jgi:hypothetical protein
MRVNSVDSAIPSDYVSRFDPARQGSPSKPTASAGNAEISAYGAALSSSTGNTGAAARSVMSQYDLRNISYTDLVRMADELKGVGALRQEDYLDFIGPSPEHASLTGEVVSGWNLPQDYVALHEQQLAFLKSSGAEQRFIDFARYQLSLFQHFESLQPA